MRIHDLAPYMTMQREIPQGVEHTVAALDDTPSDGSKHKQFSYVESVVEIH